ncbi:hypothetical protein CQ020_09305 [Arthrobacter sp. MYb23]|uniref:hypothetical protein n=1 Tax=unclassified Arthrobacter TaxID=235627 RepID=UPI000CFAEB22|nr:MULTISPECIES: hypothetical protein [unclassified Arthrobacter]PRB42670.1 hypothetical protein CQ038_09520 [Arthrobacter sp. MYb51]PRB96653.1 hypothetical protein CQ020_09305 [Arthrobacter sp. MYb23]
MNRHKFLARGAAISTATALLLGVAGMAMADQNHGDQDVDVNVGITEIVDGGVLAMSVAGTATALTEDGSTPTVRQFKGTLPTVTVTDTRSPDEIPAGAGWYVLGTSTDFAGGAGQPAIGASHLGWAPKVIDGGASGQVAEGDQVNTSMDSGANAVGLVDQELLALALDSGAIASEGQWTANADLFMKTPATVAPGNYTAKLTLSLFE